MITTVKKFLLGIWRGTRKHVNRFFILLEEISAHTHGAQSIEKKMLIEILDAAPNITAFKTSSANRDIVIL